MKKQRGVFEKVANSGVWWIQYFDAAGRRRREKVGPKSLAIKLAEKRRTDARAGVKMPESAGQSRDVFTARGAGPCVLQSQ